jgi:nucleobase:cation symporter-1, NCS1 family
MAFNVVDQILLATGFEGAFGWNAEVVAVGVTIIGTLLAIFGHDWLHKVFRWLLYIAAPLIGIVTIAVLLGAAGGAAPKDPGKFTWVAFMAQFSLAAAYNISYAPYVSDYSRYLPKDTRTKPIISAVFLGAAGSAIWLIALGAWMASRLGVSDGLVGLQTAGNAVTSHLGGVVAFLAAAAMIATMGMNAYGAMLTVVTAVDSFKAVTPTRRWRVVTLVVLAVIWYAVAKSISGDSITAVFNALTLMLYMLVPWTAINLVDFFFVRRGHYAIMDLVRPGGVYGMWSRSGLLAFALGLLAELPFMVIPPIGKFQYTGWMANHVFEKVDVAWLVGLVVSGVAFLALGKSRNAAVENAAIAVSDRELAQLAGK